MGVLKSRIKCILMNVIGCVKRCEILKRVLKRFVLAIPFLKKFYIRLIGEPQVVAVTNINDLSATGKRVFMQLKNEQGRLR